MNGYIALISIIIICAVVLLIAVSAGLLSISEAGMGLKKNQASEAYYYASACAEQALQQIRELTPFTGTDTIVFDNGTCDYAVSSQGGGNRIITASGTINNIIRKIQITINQINPLINIISWQEVANF